MGMRERDGEGCKVVQREAEIESETRLSGCDANPQSTCRRRCREKTQFRFARGLSSLFIPFLEFASIIGPTHSTAFTFRGGGGRIRLLNHGHPEEGLLRHMSLLQQESLQGIACSESANWN